MLMKPEKQGVNPLVARKQRKGVEGVREIQTLLGLGMNQMQERKSGDKGRKESFEFPHWIRK